MTAEQISDCIVGEIYKYVKVETSENLVIETIIFTIIQCGKLFKLSENYKIQIFGHSIK